MRNLAFIILSLFFAFHSPVFAYLDPGSGSAFIQLLLGGVAGLLVLVKVYWRKLVSFFTGKKAEPHDVKDKLPETAGK